MRHRVRPASPGHGRSLRRARDGMRPDGSPPDAANPAGDPGADLHAQGQCATATRWASTWTPPAGPIGWAMECYQRGILTDKDTDGLKLNWGDAGVALELIRKISYREGFGNILAEGCARAADMVGRDSGYYALHIKGQDLYEPCRGALGWSLGTTTSTRGGGHTTGATPGPTGRSRGEGKGECHLRGEETVSSGI